MPIVENVRPVTFNSSGNILVVDDRRDIINVIQLALEEQPVQVYTAESGEIALHQIQTQPFDLLLLDAKMPGLNGFELCRIVKSHEQWRNTKIIMISASNLSDDKIRAFEAGADDYVTKPFRVQELKARVKVMLNLREAERELTRRNEQLLELIRVSGRLNAQLNLDDTVTEIVKSATRLTGADRAYLLLWDNERRQHSFVAAEAPFQNINFKGITLREGEGIAALVQQTGQLQVVSDYKSFENRSLYLPNDNQEVAGVPLRAGDRHIGVLTVVITSPDRHFVPASLDILTTLANQATIALENARLYTDLARETEKYRLIAEKASDLIISLDVNGILNYVNERVETILGYTPDEMLGKPLERFLTLEGQTALSSIMHDLLRAHPEAMSEGYYSQPQEVLAVSKEGVPVDMEFNFGLLYQPGQPANVSGIQAIGRDVTSRKRSEENERMRMVGQIASGVAHDLNNVLANVLGHAQLLKTETNDQEVLNTIQIIEQSALDGAETVRRIQEFTVQRMQQNLDVLDLNVVVQSTIDITRPRWKDDAQQKGMRIEVERELGQIPPVRGKAAELREVLINLFNNAVDAMPGTGGKIGFRTYQEDDDGRRACLEVWDSGKGMSSEVRRHIFEPFYTTKGVRGTGLGLSVAYGIITRFGGEISVESTPGKGTVFHIRLPIATNQPNEGANAGKVGAAKGKPRYTGRILAIDDEANLRTVLKRALTLAGFEVDVAANGTQALALLNQSPLAKPYDLIFSDLGMPDMSGWEVAQEVYQRWPQIPFVLVTGWGEQLDAQRLSEHHVTRTIAKPFNIQDLMELAGSLIANSGKI